MKAESLLENKLLTLHNFHGDSVPHTSLKFLKKLRLWLSARLISSKYFGGKKMYWRAHQVIVNG